MGIKSIKVTGWDEADRCLSAIAEAAREIKRIEIERDRKIDAARLEFKEDLLRLHEEIEWHEIALQDFGDANKGLFEKPRTRLLSFGTVGFKKSISLKTLKKWNWKKVLIALLRRKSKAGLRIKHTVNKRILETWSDKKLEEVGVKKVQEDNFSYSLKTEA